MGISRPLLVTEMQTASQQIAICHKQINSLSLASSSGPYRILLLEIKLLVLLSAVLAVATTTNAAVNGGATTLKAHKGCSCKRLLREIRKVQTAQMGK